MTFQIALCRLAIITLAAFAVLSLSVETANACFIPGNEVFETRPSNSDTTLPVLREITSIGSLGEDDCGTCAGEHWIVTVDGQDTPATEDTRPDLGYRIDVLDGEEFLFNFPASGFLTPAFDHQTLYLYGDIDESATISVTPIDRAGNEGEPVVHILEPISRDDGACSALGRTPGAGMLPLLVVLLFVGRRRRRVTFS